MRRETLGRRERIRRSPQGFTLAEAMMASAFFSLLSLAVLSTVSSASTILQMQTLHAGINQGGTQMLRSISREIAESSPVNPVTDATTPLPDQHLILATDANPNQGFPAYSNVRFQIPIDSEKDGNLVKNFDAGGNPIPAVTNLNPIVEWGAYRFVREPQLQSWLNGWIRYRVVNNQLLREVLTSSNGTVLATDIIIPRDVLLFNVTLNSRRVSILLTLRKSDSVNQKGATARTYQTTFDGDVLLRNGG